MLLAAQILLALGVVALVGLAAALSAPRGGAEVLGYVPSPQYRAPEVAALHKPGMSADL